MLTTLQQCINPCTVLRGCTQYFVKGTVHHEDLFLVLTALILRALARQVFTTVHPGQRDVSLMLYQGESQVASRNKQLGQFHLVGLPEAPLGVPQIEVSLPTPCDVIQCCLLQTSSKTTLHMLGNGQGSETRELEEGHVA